MVVFEAEGSCEQVDMESRNESKSESESESESESVELKNLYLNGFISHFQATNDSKCYFCSNILHFKDIIIDGNILKYIRKNNNDIIQIIRNSFVPLSLSNHIRNECWWNNYFKTIYISFNDRQQIFLSKSIPFKQKYFEKRDTFKYYAMYAPSYPTPNHILKLRKIGRMYGLDNVINSTLRHNEIYSVAHVFESIAANESITQLFNVMSSIFKFGHYNLLPSLIYIIIENKSNFLLQNEFKRRLIEQLFVVCYTKLKMSVNSKRCIKRINSITIRKQNAIITAKMSMFVMLNFYPKSESIGFTYYIQVISIFITRLCSSHI